MRTFDRTAFQFKTFQCLRFAETGNFDYMAFMFDSYKLYLPNI